MRRYFAIPYHSDSVSSPSVNLYIYIYILKKSHIDGREQSKITYIHEGTKLVKKINRCLWQAISTHNMFNKLSTRRIRDYRKYYTFIL